MRFLLFLFLFLATFSFVDAHELNLVSQESVNDITIITDPILSQAFYGKLQNFPHTYEIQSDVPFRLFTQILVPDIETSQNNISGVIIKLPEKQGRVTEIAQLNARDAEWNSEYEPFGGDSYRKGPLFEADLDSGTYRIEVHTPDNAEKYVLVVGLREEMTIGYFSTLERLIKVKEFFDKSPIRIVESAFAYIPLAVILLIAGLVWYRKHGIRKVI